MDHTAIYAGSFDPVTLGHVDVIRRAASLYDTLLVAVGNNPAKRYRFDLATRRRLVGEALADVPNISVVAFEGLLVDAAVAHKASVIVRGLRSASDFELEFRNGLGNRDLSGLETVFLLSDTRYIHVSSSLVREIAQHGGDVSRYVPACVLEALSS